MAAPHVTGALVLLAAARPDLDAAGLRAALLAAPGAKAWRSRPAPWTRAPRCARCSRADAWHPAPAATTPSAATRVTAATKVKTASKKARKAKTAKRSKTARQRAARRASARRRAAARKR